jgi:4-amino-4-deoxy-L-arabinose transferase-like glycosyltransferase
MGLRKNCRNWWRSILQEIRSHPKVYLLLSTILLCAFFVRVYRVEDLLRFYYDQGRDALVIWKLWHEGKLFLVGPITGLKGIYLGPFYYYLIAPFYLLGGGNPIYPAVFLAFLSIVAILVLFILGKKMHSVKAGLFAATIASFSYYIFTHSRWLSNPNPVLLTSVVFLWSLWEIVNHSSKYWWLVAFLTVGLSLQFESASAVFYLPMILIFGLWSILRQSFGGRSKSTLDMKMILLSFGVFFLTLIPQIAFNFRHDNILFDNFKRVLIEEESFRAPLPDVISARLDYFWGVFSSKIFPGWHIYAKLFTILSTIVILSSKKFRQNVLPLFLIFLGVPMLGFTFFQGNYGNIYDYYMAGYYLPMILLFSIGLGILWKTNLGKIAVIFFFYLFFTLNGVLVKNYLFATWKTRPIALEDQLQAVYWVFESAKTRGDFNIDVYVPPVIPYAYDYLFLWQATRRCGSDLCGIVEEQVPLLYTLYEEDPPHPQRLEVWLERQRGTGVVEEEAVFGRITVQRRKRI